MKYVLIILFCWGFQISQVRGEQIDSTFINNLYDRCLDFQEDKIDSLYYYADFIKRESARISYANGEIFYHRLLGIALEMQKKYEEALEHFLTTLSLSKSANRGIYTSAAYTDIAITYGTIKQYDKAKENFLKALDFHYKSKSISGIVNCLANLGTAYFRLNNVDSATWYLNESLRIGNPYDTLLDISSTYNNLGNIYYQQKKYDLALEHFRYGLNSPFSEQNPTTLWLSHLNLAYVFLDLNQYDSVQYHIRKAETLAEILQSKSKTADLFALKSNFEAQKGNFKQAYEYQKKWYEYDTSYLRLETQNTILELQDKYNINEKIAENKLLQERYDAESFKNRTFIIYIILLALIILVVFKLFIDKRKNNRELQLNNEQMAKKNEQLAALNRQKNDLIGMVSHDLKTPFLSIGMWSQIIESDSENLTAEQITAIQKIQQSCQYGEDLIQRILNIEKNFSGKDVTLQEISLFQFVNSIGENFQPKLKEKNLSLNISVTPPHLKMMTDVQILSRILENLLSNAIKFSYPHNSIDLRIQEVAGMIEIVVHDYGVGIEATKLPTLFEKFGGNSNLGTKGEEGNGWGLTIVKRLVEEIGGAITCQSAENQGTSFIIILRK